MKTYLLALGLLLAAPSTGSGQAATDFGFAVHLFEEGDYYRAITELERFSYFKPDAPEAEGARWLTAAAYLKGERWEHAAEHYAAYLGRYPKSAKAEAAAFFLAESLYESRSLPEARAAYAALLKAASAEFQLWAALRLASLDLAERHFGEAAQRFHDAQAGLDTATSVRLAELEQQARRGAAFSPYSPGGNALLSALLPGLGQFRVGYQRDGISSLALVAGFAAWALVSHANHNDTSAWIFAGIGGIFYFGNVHGGYIAAKRMNDQQPREAAKAALDNIKTLSEPQPDLGPWIHGGKHE